MTISPDLSSDKRYTYADYLTWNDGVRYELIDGKPYIKYESEFDEAIEKIEKSATAYSLVLGELFGQLWEFAKGKEYKIFTAPLDVRLSTASDTETIVHPDIFVVSDNSKINKNGCVGSPDLVVEIMSYTKRKNHHATRKIYFKYGVLEYWEVDIGGKFITVNHFENGNYYHYGYSEEDTAPVMILPGCEINLAEVFAPLNEFTEPEEN
jgi:Uma2 family endonuclease